LDSIFLEGAVRQLIMYACCNENRVHAVVIRLGFGTTLSLHSVMYARRS